MINFEDYIEFGIADVSTSKNHDLHLKKIIRYIKYSRFNIVYKIPFLLTWIQVQIARKIGGLEDALSKGEIEIRKLEATLPTALDKKKVQTSIASYRGQWLINKHLIKEWRWVADGIVWRFLNYKREEIRLLSENASSGFIKFSTKGFKKELEVFISLGIFGWKKALLSDITNCLRTGDIILKHSEKHFEILEIKNSDQEGKNNKRVRRQKERINNITRALNKKEILTSKGRVIFAMIGIPLESHLGKLHSLIKSTESGRCGILSKMDNVVTVAVHNYSRALSLLPKDPTEEDFSKILDIKAPDFKNRDKVLRVSSFDHFNQKGGEFMRLVPPYSVYPFSAQICGKLMSGKILTTIWVDLEELKMEFVARGWKIIEEVDFEFLKNEIQRLKQEKSNNQERYRAMSYDTFLKIQKDQKIVHLPFSIVMRMGYELLTTETIIKFADSVPIVGRPGDDIYGSVVQFSNERNLWR